MRISRTLIGLVGGLAVATATVALQPTDATARARRKGKARGALRILDINVEAQANVPQNRVIEIRFNGTPDKRTVNPAQFQIRAQNANGTGPQEVRACRPPPPRPPNGATECEAECRPTTEMIVRTGFIWFNS